MPTVFSQDGYNFVVYLGDHLPPHVHAKHSGREATVYLNPVELDENWGFNEREVGKILKIIKRNRGRLLEAWEKRGENQ